MTSAKSNKHSEIYTVEEVAKLLGICRNTAYKGVNSGEIPSIRIGRSIKIPKAALENFIENKSIKAHQENYPKILRMTKVREQTVLLNIRVPIMLNNKLVEAAAARGVSLTAEISDRLNSTFLNSASRAK